MSPDRTTNGSSAPGTSMDDIVSPPAPSSLGNQKDDPCGRPHTGFEGFPSGLHGHLLKELLKLLEWSFK
jgi:hypothetical protein